MTYLGLSGARGKGETEKSTEPTPLPRDEFTVS